MSVVLRLLLLIVAFFFFLGILGFLFKLVWIVAFLVAMGVCFLVALGLFKRIILPTEAGAGKPKEMETKLWCEDGLVSLFDSEPDATKLIEGKMSSASDNLVIQVPSETTIKILAESELALKVKLTSGDRKGAVGWVDKSDVAGYK